MTAAAYNFAYLDEQTKRMIRRALLKAVAVPGYQVPFASREMPMPYGWGTGGVQVTAAVLGPDDVLKVIDQGADDTTNAVSNVTAAMTNGLRPAACNWALNAARSLAWNAAQAASTSFSSRSSASIRASW